jgi:hypothetical protein
LKLGTDISQAPVAKYRVPSPLSESWRTFLDNHLSELASIDFFTVPTICFDVLFVFVVLAHDVAASSLQRYGSSQGRVDLVEQSSRR